MTKKQINTILIIIYSLVALFYSFLRHLVYDYNFSFLIKSIPMTTLIIMTLINVESKYKPLLVISLLFSLAGDIVLDIDRERLFMIGLVVFLIAHIIYIVLFLKSSIISKKSIPLIIPVIIYSLALLWLFRNIEGFMKYGVFLYIIIISAMTCAAAFFRNNRKGIISLLPFIGAVVFMISDTVIALNKFLIPFEFYYMINLSTYFLAQLLIVSGFVYEKS